MPTSSSPELGVLFHAIGGLAAASFYIPFRKVGRWSWETYWLVAGIVSWLIAPTVGALLTTTTPFTALASAPASSLMWCFVYGALWGVGGLTFGLSMRYLGMSLGYALALGACAAFGTLLPPLYFGTFASLLSSTSGFVILAGVLICLAGIAVCGKAGINKERELTDEQKRATISEFSFKKGVMVALFAGVMSACMAFAIAAGKPIADAAIRAGSPAVFSNNPVYIVAMAGGFATNAVWCIYLGIKNKTLGEYFSASAPVLLNILFCAAAGITWYLQFFFYGMGSVKLGERYDFSSWTLHMAFIIVFSNLWGLAFREWRDASANTRRWIAAGIAVLILSTVVIGAGNKMADEPAEPETTVAVLTTDDFEPRMNTD
jgi:L-rhamnose-H+ transport protein